MLCFNFAYIFLDNALSEEYRVDRVHPKAVYFSQLQQFSRGVAIHSIYQTFSFMECRRQEQQQRNAHQKHCCEPVQRPQQLSNYQRPLLADQTDHSNKTRMLKTSGFQSGADETSQLFWSVVGLLNRIICRFRFIQHNRAGNETKKFIV